MHVGDGSSSMMHCGDPRRRWRAWMLALGHTRGYRFDAAYQGGLRCLVQAPADLDLGAASLRPLLNGGEGFDLPQGASGRVAVPSTVSLKERAEMLRPKIARPDAGAPEDAEISFRHLMDTAPVMIWVSGTDKLCTWFNKPWLEFTGRTMAQEHGDGWTAGVHPDDFDRCMEIYASHFDRRVPFRIEYRLRRADGEFRWILDTGVPRFTKDGAFEGYIGSCIDINALKQAELGLKDSVVSRDAALDALDRIAGGIAHDFKNLMNAFVSALWFIRRSADDPSAVRRQAEEAEKTVIQADQIIEQLLATVRDRPRSETIHVNRLVAESRAILRGAAGQRVSIEMDLVAEPDDAIVGPAHLQAALLNLVTNARDALPEGGAVTIETRNVTVRPESIDEPDLAPGRYIMLTVRDTGVGMSDEVLHHAFEPFFTTKEPDRGTGLGLSQVRAFARHSGGTVRIESAPSKGTAVRIYLSQDAGTLEDRGGK